MCMDVPLKLTFKSNATETAHNFLASVEVTQTPTSAQPFTISKWFTKLKTVGMEPNDWELQKEATRMRQWDVERLTNAPPAGAGKHQR
jgi:hypothetical protein